MNTNKENKRRLKPFGSSNSGYLQGLKPHFTTLNGFFKEVAKRQISANVRGNIHHKKEMQNHYLSFKKIARVSPTVQITAIVLLYALSVYFGYIEFQKTGLTQWGFPPSGFIYFAAIYEEIIFRGLILAALRQKHTILFSIIVSSLLFGMRHLRNIFRLGPTQVTAQVLYTMLFVGPLLSYVTLKYKTIWPGVILHFLNNLLAPIISISALISIRH